jgi:hypothetical protein
MLQAAAPAVGIVIASCKSSEPMKHVANTITHDFIAFGDVEALDSNGLGLLCRVNGREVWVPYANMATRECTVRRPGDRGLLVVPHWLAVNLKLLDLAA